MPEPTLSDLNERFGRGDAIRFEPGKGGLVRAAIHHAGVTGEVYLHGAHVTAWRPRDAEPVLFISERSYFEPGKPIRGGVPICFPWFGPKADDPAAPAHGTARLVTWDVAETRTTDSDASITLATAIAPFRVTHRVEFGASLRMSLTVENTADAPQRFEAALHTYLRVADVRQLRITGLEGATYLDKMDNASRKRQEGPITFTAETDRIYVDTPVACVLHDPGLKRRITVAKTGSLSTVVWNPWIRKAAQMPDFGDHEWPAMTCIETCNVADNAVTLAPGQTHEMTATIAVDAS